jgi:L-lactate dehydrogenase complex protein LldF
MSVRVGHTAEKPAFPILAHDILQDQQTRRNVRHATDVIRNKRALRVDEMPDWQDLRTAGHAIKTHTLLHLPHYLEMFERNCIAAGGQVHWARDADEANAIAIRLINAAAKKQANAHPEVIKVKTMTSDEIGMNAALEKNNITPWETDLADMIVQMGHDEPSHIVVPALHKNRHQVRELFLENMKLTDLGTEAEDLTAAARTYLRRKFLEVGIGVSGANFAIAETGSVVVVESEGNGRMCITMPKTLITLVGIEKVIPKFDDLEVFLQLLPRSATGERMNPYNSIWTGTAAGDGPEEFHVILLDNGRTRMMANVRERETLNCIRCGACLNACPVYRETGGHAYGSIYSGPIGAILSPQLNGMKHSRSLPYASSLCGACYEVCPVKINIPETLIHLRGKIVAADQNSIAGKFSQESMGMKMAAHLFEHPRQYEAAQRMARTGQGIFEKDGKLVNLPGMAGGWTQFRDLRALPNQTFREWWKKNRANGKGEKGGNA